MSFITRIEQYLSERKGLRAGILGAIVIFVSWLGGNLFGRHSQRKADEKEIAQAHTKVREYQAKLNAAGDNARLARKYERMLNAALAELEELEGRGGDAD